MMVVGVVYLIYFMCGMLGVGWCLMVMCICVCVLMLLL